MVQSTRKKRLSSRLKVTRTSLDKAKSSVRGLRSNKKLRNSVNKSVKSNVSQTKNLIVPEKKQVVSAKRKSATKINASPVRRTRTNTAKSKSDNKPQSGKEDVSVKPKKAVIVKNNKKPAKKKSVKKINHELNDSVSLRQMSLKESFSRQVISARLRPRANEKNYCEDSRMSGKNLSNTKSPLTKVVKNGPVYKHVDALDNVNSSDEDVYNFKFDDNDSRERRVRKKKRRVIRRGVLKSNLKKKAVVKRAQSAKAETKVTTSNNLPEVESPPTIQVTNNNAKPTKPEITNKNDECALEKVNEAIDESTTSVAVEPVDSFVFVKPTDNSEQSKEIVVKPKVVPVELIKRDNVNVVLPTIKSDDSVRSFDRHDVFAKPPNQYKSMINHSLINRSLSPIPRATENFDVGSPWRPPLYSAFSHARDLFHSTPQLKKIEVYTGKIVRNVNNMNNVENIAPKLLETTEKSDSRKSSLTRKFGTEITNIDNSVSSSPNVNEDRSERVPESLTIPPVVRPESSTASSNISFNDVAEDKENAAPNCQTPKKILMKKKKKMKQMDKLQTLHRVLGRKVLQTKEENLEPQPGPSGIQNLSPPKNDRLLRQSNLSGFLNLTPMPESIQIMTPHGIFGDAHSTPVNGKQPKKAHKEDAVENAFGFTDSDSDLDISPVTGNVQTDAAKMAEKLPAAKVKTEAVIPARLSVGEIQRKLLVPKRVKNKDALQTKLPQGLKKIPEREKKENLQRKKVLIDVSNFSDTFDVLSETADSIKDESINDFPLFADLEPSRFLTPPKHSYKRKRNVKFSFLDESDAENMDDSSYEPEVKKKKANKLNREDEKRLKNWVESVNQTFSEIDQFDLVVE